MPDGLPGSVLLAEASLPLLGSQVNTLVNALLQVLTIEGIELLQLSAIQVLVSIFHEYPDQRKGLVEAFIYGVLFNTPTVPKRIPVAHSCARLLGHLSRL